MRVWREGPSGRDAQAQLVFLPPAKSSIEEMRANGVGDVLKQWAPRTRLVMAEVGATQLMAGSAVKDLHEQIVNPLRQNGAAPIWLAGISLGGLLAVLYAAEHAKILRGVVLLAPYPGTGDIVQEIVDQQGLMSWAELSTCRAHERSAYAWLARHGREGAPAVYLSSSRQDRFIRGQALMAQGVIEERQDWVDGVHEWPVWQVLWRRWLARGLLNRVEAE